MSLAVSSANQAPPLPPAAAPAPQKTAPPQTDAPPKTTDSVQLSSAASATLANLQEARETPAQTSKEAAHGDLQARRLQAKEVAAEAH